MKITFDRETEVALREACAVTEIDNPRDLAIMAIKAVCQEIVNQGGMILPMAVSLRAETAEESAARLVCLKVTNNELSDPISEGE